jgi:hypothetical protein
MTERWRRDDFRGKVAANLSVRGRGRQLETWKAKAT